MVILLDNLQITLGIRTDPITRHDIPWHQHSRLEVVLLVSMPLVSTSRKTVLMRLVFSDSTGFASPSTLNTPRDWQPQTPNDPGRNAYGGPPPPQPSPLQQSSHDTQASASSSPAPGTVPGSSQPSLMRTSQLAGGPATMNTYVISNAKASLQLQQDLNLMAVGW
jgi:hypothetical protein